VWFASAYEPEEFTPKVIWAIVKVNAKSCGVPTVAPHDLRRTCHVYATRNLEVLPQCFTCFVVSSQASNGLRGVLLSYRFGQEVAIQAGVIIVG